MGNCKSQSKQQVKRLKILHFNDVYEISEKDENSEIAGGISRFVTALKQSR